MGFEGRFAMSLLIAFVLNILTVLALLNQPTTQEIVAATGTPKLGDRIKIQNEK